jgi:hypothetical protein
MNTVVSTLGVGTLCTSQQLKNVLLMMPELVHHTLLILMPWWGLYPVTIQVVAVIIWEVPQ